MSLIWAAAFGVKKKKRREAFIPLSKVEWNVVHLVRGTWVFWGQELLEWTEPSPWSCINLKSVGGGWRGRG